MGVQSIECRIPSVRTKYSSHVPKLVEEKECAKVSSCKSRSEIEGHKSPQARDVKPLIYEGAIRIDGDTMSNGKRSRSCYAGGSIDHCGPAKIAETIMVVIESLDGGETSTEKLGTLAVVNNAVLRVFK